MDISGSSDPDVAVLSFYKPLESGNLGEQTMTKIIGALGIGVLSLGVVACNSSSSPVAPSAAMGATEAAGPGAEPGDMTIVEIVLQDDGEFDVLQAAVVQAGLVDALSGSDQLTVFAPTDAAFCQHIGRCQ